jgi:hypothetical protein
VLQLAATLELRDHKQQNRMSISVQALAGASDSAAGVMRVTGR